MPREERFEAEGTNKTTQRFDHFFLRLLCKSEVRLTCQRRSVSVYDR